MEMVLSMAASMTAKAAVAGTVAGAAAGAAAAGTTAAAGSTLLTIAQGGLTAFSALSSIGAGIAARSEANAAASLRVAEAGQAVLAGRDEANHIRARLAEAVGNQQVAWAAAGINVNSGTAQVMQRDSIAAGNDDIRRTLTGAQLRSSGLLAQASTLRGRGRAAFAQGIVRAVRYGGDFLLDTRIRG